MAAGYSFGVSKGWVLPAIVDRVVEFASEKGIPRRKLDQVVGARTGAAVRGDAAHAVLAYVVRELDDPVSVWDAARGARPADYGAYGFALQASETLGEALTRAARFFATIGTTAEMAITTGQRAARIVVRRRDGARSPGAELGTQYVVAQIVRLMGAISGEKARVRAVYLGSAPPRDVASLERALGVVPTFGSPSTAIEVDRAVMDSLLPRRDPDLIRHFERELRHDEERSTSATVRQFLEQAIALGRPTAEDDVARALGIGPRTLRRQLADEATTLREVFDAVRLEWATARLRASRVSIAALALELGFSDQTAFSRAFRRWTGRSPAEFHRALTR